MNATLDPAQSALSSSGTRHLYWCVDGCWSEPLKTHRVAIETSTIQTDQTLFRQLRDSYDRIRGLRGRLLSWKSCQHVSFIKVRACSNVSSQRAVVLMFSQVLHGVRRSQRGEAD